MNVHLFHLWTATVERSPRATALIDGKTGRKWSRAALAAGSAEWAAAYAGTWRGSRSDRRRVALSVPNGAEWFHAFLGLLSLGAVPAPIDPSEPEESQREAAASIGATHLWSAGRLVAVGAGPAKVGRDECLVKLTSASSGAARGLAATHEQMVADGRQICATMGIGAGDLNLASIPLGYSYGLGNLVLPLLDQGTPLVCVSSALPQALAADVARFKPTVFPAVPPVLRALASSDLPAMALSSLRLVISAGSPLAPEVARAFAGKFRRKVHGFYGASETGGISFDRTGAATLSGRSVGRPMKGVTIRGLRSGRIMVSSPAILGTGHFSPSDNARIAKNGELVLLGRTDRVVKIGGRRADLAEIERALKATPGISDAFAHLVPGPEPVLAAAFVAKLSALKIRGLLRGRLASWKMPTRLLALDKFPVTSRGKPDSRRLRQLLAAPRTESSISTLSAARQMSAER
jgi:long-chain acyl-CoA synthetase